MLLCMAHERRPARGGAKVAAMRILRITLAMLLLGPISACFVSTDKGGRSTQPVSGGEPSGASVAGRVVDASTGEPIKQVAVDIIAVHDHSTVATVSTAADGTFHTESVPPGTYILNVRRNGYAAQSHQNYDLRPGTTEFNVRLQKE
jgi:hypothetical protein